MKLPNHKTKIICTIGPSSNSPEMLEKMVISGMNIARLNFSHGDFSSHKKVIETIRSVSEKTGCAVTIMADMPGPKMRIGQFEKEPVNLAVGNDFVLTAREITGNAGKVSVTFRELPRVVKPGNILFLNDGLIQLQVKNIDGEDVSCSVVVGGELYSRKGLNVPDINLGISAFTERDRECLKFAVEEGVDAVSQSFVETEDDILAVRQAAAQWGRVPFIIAKIERSRALDNIDTILKAADGIMIARGDLGVEIPIEKIALAQKQLTRKANALGKPVITATQMLESMTHNRRPTRAEATDVANAILDGTDCVMLSEESAMGDYPCEAVDMLTRIAACVEPSRPAHILQETLKGIVAGSRITSGDLISLSVESALERMPVTAVVIPTHGGATARRLARMKLPVWVVAAARQQPVCQGLQFSYGVYPVFKPTDTVDWEDYAKKWVRDHELAGDSVILIEGPSPENPGANHRLEIIEIR